MKKRLKLLFTIISLCVAFGSLMMGVFALTQATYTVKGSMSYSMEYGLIDIQTSVYRYVGAPITKTEGMEYLENLGDLEELPEYSKQYCTYDENYLLKDTIENQIQQDLDFKYTQGQAYFVVIHATSQTKDKAIKVTVNTTFNVENSWFYTSGSTVLFKNKTGKDIIFAWGIERAVLPANGNFNFEMTFEEDTTYVPQNTAKIAFNIPDIMASEEAYVENVNLQLNEFNEAEYLEQKMWMEVPSSKMIFMPDEDYNSYAPVINFSIGGYTVKTVVSYSLGGVALYDQNGKLIPATENNLVYVYLPSIHFVNAAEIQAYITEHGMPSFTSNPPSATVELEPGEEIKGCILVGVMEELDATQKLTNMTFSLKVSVQEIAPTIKQKLPYTHRFQPMMNELNSTSPIAYIVPGSDKKKEKDKYIVEDHGFTMLEMEDRQETLMVSGSEITEYVESGGMYEFSSHIGESEVYANPLIWLQLFTAGYYALREGYLPIVKTEVTIDGHLYKPENWMADFYMVYQNISDANLEQHFIPVPSSMDEMMPIPVNLYKANVSVMAALLAILVSDEEQVPNIPFDAMFMMYHMVYQLAVQQGEIADQNLTYKQFVFAFMSESLDLGSNTGNLLQRLDAVVQLEWTPFVKGDEIPVDAIELVGYGSKYYTYDVVQYESSSLMNMSELDCVSYESSQAYFLAIDGCGYTADGNMFVRYPNLKTGDSYEVIDGVETIANWAFRNAKYLKEVTFPNSVNQIDYQVFENSTVEVWNVYTATLNSQKDQIILNINTSNIHTLNIYATSIVDQDIVDEIVGQTFGVEVNVVYTENISGLSFEQKADGMYVSGVQSTGIYELVIPEYVTISGTKVNVVGINNGVFASCTSLTEVMLPKTLKTIGNNNFGNCTSLTKLYLVGQDIVTFGTGNVHSNMQIFTGSENTYNIIRQAYPNSIGVDMHFEISGGIGDLDFAFTLGTRAYNFDGKITNSETNYYNIKMLVFPTSSVNSTISSTLNIQTGNDTYYISETTTTIVLAQKTGDSYTYLMGVENQESYNSNNYSGMTTSFSFPATGSVSVNCGADLILAAVYGTEKAYIPW